MAIIPRLKRLLGIDTSDEEGSAYQCVNCGHSFERPHRECPECGGTYVARNE